MRRLLAVGATVVATLALSISPAPSVSAWSPTRPTVYLSGGRTVVAEARRTSNYGPSGFRAVAFCGNSQRTIIVRGSWAYVNEPAYGGIYRSYAPCPTSAGYWPVSASYELTW